MGDAPAARAAARKTGMVIQSVLRGWVNFNSSKPSAPEASLGKSTNALRLAVALGAAAVLLVLCRIGGMEIPKPMEFDLRFDPADGHLSRVASGDNTAYADSIAAQNHATDTSREAIRQLIPLANETGVVIALENLWNNLWVKPAILSQYVGSFASPLVGAHFDIGNHVKYAPTEAWIYTPGPLICRCHVKGVKLGRDPEGGGSFLNIREGNVHWPEAPAALNEMGYNERMTIEGGNCSLEEHSRPLDLILTGQ